MAFNCNVCKNVFTTKSNLKRHTVSQHENIIWQYCDYKCKQNGDLKKYARAKHNVDTQWHQYDYSGCIFKYKEKSKIKRHKVSIHYINVI